MSACIFIRGIHKTLANLIKRSKPLNSRPEIASCQQQVNTLSQLHILLLVFTNIILQACNDRGGVVNIVSIQLCENMTLNEQARLTSISWPSESN